MSNPKIKTVYMDCCETSPDSVRAEMEIGVNDKNLIFISVSYPDDDYADWRVINLDYDTAEHLLGHLQAILESFRNG